MNDELQNLLRRTGCHKCPHFIFQRVAGDKTKKSCCGRSSANTAFPVCSLVGQACPGLAMCPRLNIETKSKLIESWTHELKRGIIPDPRPFIRG